MRSTHEKPALRAQGAISLSPRGYWRLGRLDLRDSTFAFSGPGRHGAVHINLDSITSLGRERRKFVLAGKYVLRLTYRPPGAARPRSCWLITARLADWEAALGQRMAGRPGDAAGAEPPVPVPRRLAARLTALSAASALILDYLTCRGHATTAELMTLIGAETPEILLSEMQEGLRQIGPVPGGPAIRYEGTYFDRMSRQVRRQTWRIGEAVAAGWLASRMPADVLEEDGELLVITSVPTQTRDVLPAVRIVPDGSGIVVRHAFGAERWIELPGRLDGEPRCALGPTGTLVIRGLRRASGDHGKDLT